jgi:hypothetical protein
MIKKFSFIFFTLIFVSLTSCIDIVQEIKINPNKSGSIRFSMDLGALGGSFMNIAKDYIDLSMMEDIKKQPSITAKVIENIKGISNIKPVSDNNKGLYALSFDFDNEKALNEAYYKMFNSNKNIFLPRVFKISRRSIKTANLAPVIRYFTNKYEKDIKDNKLFSLVSLKQLFILPGMVKKVSNPKFNIDDYKVDMSCTIEELLNSNVNIGNKIWF